MSPTDDGQVPKDSSEVAKRQDPQGAVASSASTAVIAKPAEDHPGAVAPLSSTAVTTKASGDIQVTAGSPASKAVIAKTAGQSDVPGMQIVRGLYEGIIIGRTMFELTESKVRQLAAERPVVLFGILSALVGGGSTAMVATTVLGFTLSPGVGLAAGVIGLGCALAGVLTWQIKIEPRLRLAALENKAKEAQLKIEHRRRCRESGLSDAESDALLEDRSPAAKALPAVPTPLQITADAGVVGREAGQ